MPDNASVARLTEVRTRTVLVCCHLESPVNALQPLVENKLHSSPTQRYFWSFVHREGHLTRATLNRVSVLTPEAGPVR